MGGSGLRGRCARHWLFALILLTLNAQSLAQEQCLKQVFSQYCLGGDIEQVLQAQPNPQYQERRGERFALLYPDGRNTVYVMSFRGLIYKVVRKYRSSTMLQFNDLMRLLSEKYGEPENNSHFPDYAKVQASRISAIRSGEGRAHYTWKLPGQPWHIDLSWTREMGLALAYIADELDAQQKQSLDSGY